MLSGQATSGEILLDSIKLAENIRSTVNKEDKAGEQCSTSLPKQTVAEIGTEIYILYIHQEAMGLVRPFLWLYLQSSAWCRTFLFWSHTIRHNCWGMQILLQSYDLANHLFTRLEWRDAASNQNYKNFEFLIQEELSSRSTATTQTPFNVTTSCLMFSEKECVP